MSSRRPQGFTLLEVVVAVAITALMGISISMALSSGIHTKEVIEKDVERYRSLRAAMGRMTHEIDEAFFSYAFDAKRFRDPDRPTNFIGERDRLVFTSFAHQRLYQDAKESDQMTVEYYVRSSTERNAHGRHDLIRRENPVVDGPMDKGGTEDVLLENVREIHFFYWDPDKKEWQEEWDTRKVERQVLPPRVKVVVTAPDENGKDTKYTTQAIIMLTHPFPRFDT